MLHHARRPAAAGRRARRLRAADRKLRPAARRQLQLPVAELDLTERDSCVVSRSSCSLSCPSSAALRVGSTHLPVTSGWPGVLLIAEALAGRAHAVGMVERNCQPIRSSDPHSFGLLPSPSIVPSVLSGRAPLEGACSLHSHAAGRGQAAPLQPRRCPGFPRPGRTRQPLTAHCLRAVVMYFVFFPVGCRPGPSVEIVLARLDVVGQAAGACRPSASVSELVR